MPRHDPTDRKGYSHMANEWLDTAKNHPTATAAAAAGAAGAVAAGVYLWTKRNEISSHMRDWADKLQASRPGRELMKTEGPNESDAIESSRRTASRSSGRKSRSSRSNSRSTASASA